MKLLLVKKSIFFQGMKYRFKVKQKETVVIHADQPYSNISLAVLVGEVYSFAVAEDDKWTDLFITKNANGFNNIFIPEEKLRLPKAKCFELCGTINRDEENHFRIGTSRQVDVSKSGEMYFFANDSRKLNKKGRFKWYKNNKGCIRLTIIRLK